MNFNEKINYGQLHLSANDKVISELIKKYGQCTIKPHKNYYSELVSSIVSQQLSTKAASTIWKRLLDLNKGKLPDPIKLSIIEDESLRRCGISYQKISYIKDLAKHIIEGQLDLENINSLSNQDLINRLTAVRGLGVWSAHMFMIFSLGRLDVLPVGDLGIKKAIMKNYCLEYLPTEKQMIKISELNHWHPYESIASWYLWKSLDNK